MKKSSIIIVLISLVILAVICIIGNVITVADKISQLSPWLSYVFYMILLSLTAVFIVWPTVKIIITPELGPSEELMSEDKKSEGVEIIKTAAKNVFLLTSISQNGTLDIFTSISININLINRMLELRGKRPSFTQILKLYASVFSTSVLIASADEALKEINLAELLGFSGAQLTGVILRSATNGAINSFVTMRVGLTALKYLEVGEIKFKDERNKIRKEIRRKAVKCMPAVVGGGVKDGILGLKNLF